MKKYDILIKCLTLLYRESLVDDLDDTSSAGLVRTILAKLKKSSKTIMGINVDTENELIDLIYRMINSNGEYTKDTILESAKLILNNDKDVYEVLKESITKEMEPGGLKRSILSLKNILNSYYISFAIRDHYTTTAMMFNRGLIPDPIEFLREQLPALEALADVTKTKLPGVVDIIDFSDANTLTGALTKVKTQSASVGRYKSGWKELNDMLGGGFRPGEMAVISALQHNYKSGLVQTLFAQFCMYNKPILKDKTKRPLNLFISLEDDTDIIMGHIFNFLYYSENNELPDIKKFDSEAVASYIIERLQKTGFDIKFMRVNPSDWTYTTLFRALLDFEAKGYEINILVIDYLSKLPTTGCATSGPMGTDMRDLFNRVRNFCSSRGIFVLTPHQMSVDAKQLLRNGVHKLDLVKEVANKGYYEGSRQLDQVVDLEIYISQGTAYPNSRNYFLAFQRGKRRYPEIVDDDKKYFRLPFPKGAPIPPNITLDGEYIGFKYTHESNVANLVTNKFDF